MPEHPNAALIRDVLRAVARGESDRLKQFCADGIQWHATGRTPWAGDHEGIDAVLDYLGRMGEAADVLDVALTRAVVRIPYDSTAYAQQLPPNFVRPALARVLRHHGRRCVI